MYVPSSGATTDAKPSCQTSAASSLEASSNRFASRIATYGSKSVIPSRMPFDLGRDPLPLLRLDDVVVDVLVVGHAVDRRRSSRSAAAWRSRCSARPRRRPCSAPTLNVRSSLTPVAVRSRRSCRPSRAVGGDLERRLDLAVVDHLELRRRDPRLIEEDLLGVGQPPAGEGDLDLGARAGRRAAGRPPGWATRRRGRRAQSDRTSDAAKVGFMAGMGPVEAGGSAGRRIGSGRVSDEPRLAVCGRVTSIRGAGCRAIRRKVSGRTWLVERGRRVGVGRADRAPGRRRAAGRVPAPRACDRPAATRGRRPWRRSRSFLRDRSLWLTISTAKSGPPSQWVPRSSAGLPGRKTATSGQR